MKNGVTVEKNAGTTGKVVQGAITACSLVPGVGSPCVLADGIIKVDEISTDVKNGSVADGVAKIVGVAVGGVAGAGVGKSLTSTKIYTPNTLDWFKNTYGFIGEWMTNIGYGELKKQPVPIKKP